MGNAVYLSVARYVSLSQRNGYSSISPCVVKNGFIPSCKDNRGQQLLMAACINFSLGKEIRHLKPVMNTRRDPPPPPLLKEEFGGIKFRLTLSVFITSLHSLQKG